jgi:hypothetical protein
MSCASIEMCAGTEETERVSTMADSGAALSGGGRGHQECWLAGGIDGGGLQFGTLFLPVHYSKSFAWRANLTSSVNFVDTLMSISPSQKRRLSNHNCF